MSPLALSLRFLQAQPDRRLVALARDGHVPAFEALVRRYRTELLSYCRRLEPGNAEDALQQALLQAWRALTAGAEVRDVRPWLYRIARNVVLSNLRIAVATPQAIEDAAAGPELEQLVEQRLQVRAALAEMASLPALQRQVILRTTLDGASHDEIARALGLSSGAVRGLIYRARATLRSAAAAFTPSPVLHWVLRRGEMKARGASTIAEAVAGGGGAGVVALVAKGGAVLTLAGAVAGAGGTIFQHHSRHPGHAPVRLVSSSGIAWASPAASTRQSRHRASSPVNAGGAGAQTGGLPLRVTVSARPRVPSGRGSSGTNDGTIGGHAGNGSRGGFGSEAKGGRDGGSSRESRGGSSGGSSGGPDEQAASGATSGRTSSGSSGSNSEGSSGSTDGLTGPGTSGSDGGTSGASQDGGATVTGSSGSSSGSGGDSSSTFGSADSGDAIKTSAPG